MMREAIIKQLQDKYGITILNDWNEHGDRYWYIDICGHVHLDPDGNNVRFDSYDSALDYCVENLASIEKN